jgi:four helix bundle protein
VGMHNYKELLVWKESMKLVTEVYRKVSLLPTSENYIIRSQILRCAVSIPSNIAEGAGRNSYKDFKNFLAIANGSTCELETQLLICVNVGYFNDSDLQPIMKQINFIRNMLFKLQQTVENRKESNILKEEEINYQADFSRDT